MRSEKQILRHATKIPYFPTLLLQFIFTASDGKAFAAELLYSPYFAVVQLHVFLTCISLIKNLDTEKYIHESKEGRKTAVIKTLKIQFHI